MEENKLILVVDDENRMRRFMRMNLELEGYRVIEAENGLQAVNRTREDLPDGVILDVMMPEMDGFEALRLIREISAVPVIMLTVKSDEDDKIKGLELGADDYITKPFSPRELASRLKAVIRRSEIPSPSDKSLIKVDDYLQIDFNRRMVVVAGKEIKLRPTEYRLLFHLVNNAGWTLPHETLLSKVWGHEYRDETHYLRLYITYLRNKIEPDSANPRYILTERGVGYRFVDFKKQAESPSHE
jgi:two-component system, OmpR family, KDP operon response regulator KdpE